MTLGPVPRMFVYGTLRPGDVRWSFLEPWVVDHGVDDSVTGRLYDTGLGYPAAVFGEGGTILGRTYELRRSTLDEALRVIDDEEDTVLGLYRRVRVTTEQRKVLATGRSGKGESVARPRASCTAPSLT